MKISIRKRLAKLLCTVLAFSCLLPTLALSGCKEPTETSEEETETVATTVAEPTATPTATPSPTPTPDPKPEALEKAAQVGLSEEDLCGRYGLFLRYSRMITYNHDLGRYAGFLYKYFPLVAHNLKEENEDYFFNKVRTLSVYDVDSDDFAAAFFPSDNAIEIAYKGRDYLGEGYLSLVLYHEFIHFIDYTIDGEQGFLCETDTGNLTTTMVDTGNGKYDLSAYFVEGGPNLYYAKYVTHAAHTNGPNDFFLVGLEYIIGEDKVEEMFFSHDSEMRLVELLQENDFSNEEIAKFFAAQHLVNEGSKIDVNDYLDPREVLIRLYIRYKGTDFENDAVFRRILACMDGEQLNKIPSRYKDFLSKLKMFSDSKKNEFVKVLKKGLSSSEQDAHMDTRPYVMLVNGEPKLAAVLEIFKNDKLVFKTVIMDFDFEKDAIIDYKIYDQSEWIPVTVESKKYDEGSDEANAVLSEISNDNSAAHKQVASGGIEEIQKYYDRATAIQERYGINVWFADLTPNGVLPSNAAKIKDYQALGEALTEVEMVLKLYPDDFFEQMLVEDYTSFAICFYENYDEHAFKKTLVLNGSTYLMLNVNTYHTYFLHQGERDLYEQYFPFGGKNVSELICSIWDLIEQYINTRNGYIKNPSVSEKNWSALNPGGFKYLQSNEADKLSDAASKTKMEYFLENESLASAEDDRRFIYMYIMMSTMRRSQPTELTPECQAKADELIRWIRLSFNTDKWPSETSWEKIMS